MAGRKGTNPYLVLPKIEFAFEITLKISSLASPAGVPSVYRIICTAEAERENGKQAINQYTLFTKRIRQARRSKERYVQSK
jgi:hypothetical protein